MARNCKFLCITLSTNHNEWPSNSWFNCEFALWSHFHYAWPSIPGPSYVPHSAKATGTSSKMIYIGKEKRSTLPTINEKIIPPTTIIVVIKKKKKKSIAILICDNGQPHGPWLVVSTTHGRAGRWSYPQSRKGKSCASPSPNFFLVPSRPDVSSQAPIASWLTQREVDSKCTLSRDSSHLDRVTLFGPVENRHLNMHRQLPALLMLPGSW